MKTLCAKPLEITKISSWRKCGMQWDLGKRLALQFHWHFRLSEANSNMKHV